MPVQPPQPVDSFQTTTYHLPGFTESGVQVFNNLAGPLYQVPPAMNSTNGPSTYHQEQSAAFASNPTQYQQPAATQPFPGSHYAPQPVPEYSNAQQRAPAPAYPTPDRYASTAPNYAYSTPAASPTPAFNAGVSTPGPSVPPPSLFSQPSLPKPNLEPPKPNIIKKSESLSYQAKAAPSPYSAPSTPLSAAQYKAAPSPLANKYSLGAPPPKASGAANPFAKHKPTETDNKGPETPRPAPSYSEAASAFETAPVVQDYAASYSAPAPAAPPPAPVPAVPPVATPTPAPVEVLEEPVWPQQAYPAFPTPQPYQAPQPSYPAAPVYTPQAGAYPPQTQAYPPAAYPTPQPQAYAQPQAYPTQDYRTQVYPAQNSYYSGPPIARSSEQRFPAPHAVFAFGFGGQIAFCPTRSRTGRFVARLSSLTAVISRSEEGGFLKSLTEFPNSTKRQSKEQLKRFADRERVKLSPKTEAVDPEGLNLLWGLIHHNLQNDGNLEFKSLTEMFLVDQDKWLAKVQLLGESSSSESEEESDSESESSEAPMDPKQAYAALHEAKVWFTHRQVHFKKLLIRGELEQAQKYALTKQLWPYAMATATQMKRHDLLKATIYAMVDADLPLGSPVRSFFALESDRFDEIFQHVDRIPPSKALPGGTVLHRWRENLIMLLNTKPAGYQAAIEGLASRLAERKQKTASAQPSAGRLFFNTTSFQLTEAYAFAQNLLRPFEIANFDIYRLAYIFYLLDFGLFDQALPYLELLADRIARQLFQPTPLFQDLLRSLVERLDKAKGGQLNLLKLLTLVASVSASPSGPPSMLSGFSVTSSSSPWQSAQPTAHGIGLEPPATLPFEVFPTGPSSAPAQRQHPAPAAASPPAAAPAPAPAPAPVPAPAPAPVLTASPPAGRIAATAPPQVGSSYTEHDGTNFSHDWSLSSQGSPPLSDSAQQRRPDELDVSVESQTFRRPVEDLRNAHSRTRLLQLSMESQTFLAPVEDLAETTEFRESTQLESGVMVGTRSPPLSDHKDALSLPHLEAPGTPDLPLVASASLDRVASLAPASAPTEVQPAPAQQFPEADDYPFELPVEHLPREEDFPTPPLANFWNQALPEVIEPVSSIDPSPAAAGYWPNEPVEDQSAGFAPPPEWPTAAEAEPLQQPPQLTNFWGEPEVPAQAQEVPPEQFQQEFQPQAFQAQEQVQQQHTGGEVESNLQPITNFWGAPLPEAPAPVPAQYEASPQPAQSFWGEPEASSQSYQPTKEFGLYGTGSQPDISQEQPSPAVPQPSSYESQSSTTVLPEEGMTQPYQTWSAPVVAANPRPPEPVLAAAPPFTPAAPVAPPAPASEASAPAAPAATVEAVPPGGIKCVGCGQGGSTAAFLPCGRCGALYHDKACQRKDWNNHKKKETVAPVQPAAYEPPVYEAPVAIPPLAVPAGPSSPSIPPVPQPSTSIAAPTAAFPSYPQTAPVAEPAPPTPAYQPPYQPPPAPRSPARAQSADGDEFATPPSSSSASESEEEEEPVAGPASGPPQRSSGWFSWLGEPSRADSSSSDSDSDTDSKPKQRKVQQKSEPQPAPATPKAPDTPAEQGRGSGFLSRLWSGGKKQGDLGEKLTKVYDKELGMWIDPSKPRPTQKPKGAPPPPRPSDGSGPQTPLSAVPSTPSTPIASAPVPSGPGPSAMGPPAAASSGRRRPRFDVLGATGAAPATPLPSPSFGLPPASPFSSASSLPPPMPDETPQ